MSGRVSALRLHIRHRMENFRHSAAEVPGPQSSSLENPAVVAASLACSAGPAMSRPDRPTRGAEPDQVDRKKDDVQGQDWHEQPHGTITDEADIGPERHNAHRQHRSLGEGGQGQARGGIAQNVDPAHCHDRGPIRVEVRSLGSERLDTGDPAWLRLSRRRLRIAPSRRDAPTGGTDFGARQAFRWDGAVLAAKSVGSYPAVP